MSIETDPRLTELLSKAGDEWGPLGVLRVAAEMWPDAYSALVNPDVLAAERRGEKLGRMYARPPRRSLRRSRRGDAA